jgi:hypothetical protein
MLDRHHEGFDLCSSRLRCIDPPLPGRYPAPCGTGGVAVAYTSQTLDRRSTWDEDVGVELAGTIG